MERGIIIMRAIKINAMIIVAGITSVPFFEISLKDNPQLQHQFGGAQPIETFVAVFTRLKTLSKV